MRRRSSGPLTALGAAAVLILTSAATAPASAAPPAPLSAGSTPFRTITLITGDRISVATDGSNRVSMEDTAGRRNTQFVSRTVGGHLHVIPTAAMALLAQDRLDPRLFDVTGLLADGYDDRAATLPLLVSYQAGASLRGSAALSGLTVRRDLTAARAVAVRQPRATAATTWTALTSAGAKSLRPGIRKIWLDGVMKPSLDVSVPQIGAPEAWKAGYDGTGVTAGIIDTGVDGTHPDLAGKVIESKVFADGTDGADRYGHGTHVASTVAGTGAASNGSYKGVAPGARLYAAKVCNDQGQCAESSIIAGMQWVAEKGAQVANLSLGNTNHPGQDPVEQAVEDLTAKYGTLFVVASGNDYLWTSSPGSAPSALTVGAVDKKNVGADFSSHGTKYDDYAVKPEITAPGVGITAANSTDSKDGGAQRYRTLSGTSMATPHVTGSVALLAQAHPAWNHDQLKDALVSSATPNSDPWFVQGTGRVDVARAVSQPVAASPSTLAFGLQKAPHEQDPPISKTVTYHNSGAGPVTLSLAIAASEADGTPLPAGLFTVGPASVTVPAGGDAPVTVTATPAAITWADIVGAVLTATGDGVTVRTAMSMSAQIEGVDLTVTGLDRDGKPSGLAYTTIYSLSDPAAPVSVWGADGVGTARLRAGTYMVITQVLGAADGRQTTMLVMPQLTIDKDTAVTMDARLGKPVSLSVPRKDALTRLAHVGSNFHTPAGWYSGDSIEASNFDGILTAQVGPDGLAGETAFDIHATLEQGKKDGTSYNSAYGYYLTYYAKPGSFFTGLDKKVYEKDLSAVSTSYSAQAPNTMADSYAYYKPSFGRSQLWSVPNSFDLPIRRTEYFSTSDAVQWQKYVFTKLKVPEGGLTPVSIHQSLFTQHTPGRSRDQWTAAVFGPGLKFVPEPPPFTSRGMTRNGDQLKLMPSLLSDSTGRQALAPGKGSMTVSKDGTVIRTVPGNVAFVPVPGDPGTLQVTATQERTDPEIVATSVAVTWTFKSAHTTSAEPLPVSVIRFTPPLDPTNTARSGLPLFGVPFTVDHQGTAGVSTSVSVQVSYDDGQTWAAKPVIRKDDRGVVLVRHPAGHGYVSLKATAGDAGGNTVEQTVIRAYRY